MKQEKAAASFSPAFCFLPSRSFFLGANGADGFRSFGDAVLCESPTGTVFYIYGGPGTGKSSFLKKVRAKAEAEGVAYELYYCSSDPESLDGIRLLSGDGMRCVSVVDATAPHARMPVLSGASGHILDFGEFWNTDVLAASRDEIETLSAKKAECFRCAYSFFAPAGDLLEKACKRIAPVRREKLKTFFKTRLTPPAHPEQAAIVERPTAALSMFGRIEFPFFGGSCYTVNDRHGEGRVFLTEAAGILRELGHTVCAAPEPLLPSCYRAIYLPEADFGLAVRTGAAKDEGKMRIGRFFESRFAETDTANRLSLLLSEKFKAYGLSHLANAREYHFALERIYGKAMNFNRLEKKSEAFLARVFAALG
ncbi:MAG: hypothetical protein IJR89_08140 [Clostridia bacterium]|nr:hypothetical protein [Clostridia bacterium]